MTSLFLRDTSYKEDSYTNKPHPLKNIPEKQEFQKVDEIVAIFYSSQC